MIGEDLGTVPDWVRDRLGPAGVLSYRVFYFEREHGGGWKPPDHYPAQALAVVTTHDLPTLSGLLGRRGYRHSIRTGPRAIRGRAESDAGGTASRKDGILAALKSQGLLPAGVSEDPAQVPSMTTELMERIHAVSGPYVPPGWSWPNIEDVIGTRVQTNLPGTVDQHPNWCAEVESDGGGVGPRFHDLNGLRLCCV